jgi:TP901-1 family phage major tail protein
MGTCNTTQKEMGGKSLRIKLCKELTYTTNGTTADINTSVPHGLKVGDLWKPKAVGTATNLLTTKFYYVKAIIDTDTFQVSLNKAAVIIIPDAAIVSQLSDGFAAIGGIRSKSFSVSSEEIDITSEDSDEWKTILDKAGVRSVAFSGSGIYSNYENVKSVRASFFANEMVCLVLLETETELVWSGCFKISSVEISGDYNAESSLSLSGSSSGPVALYEMV